ncbi:carbohydrate ABC transporter permease [Pseudonocardia cypriaca]|uniref:Carbohydrate ABC transporter membrane protein 1 (CUT1 family) n=1 Tax=Pseudonocardia cypriaca TaxID=882449 RepID=A0A543FWP7_9PSEU|nr:sugar ABC transporter permease [Pseudonocardia cypriaca]TQM38266.1 carbohydrate ABC transporter membrane protein 1 (CUT1 family) [Pseudonocardia cypriaca]
MTLAERTDVRPGVAPPAPRPRRRTAVARPWLLLTPALLVMGGLLLYPLVRVLVLSLQDFGLRELVSGRTKWVGLDNYGELLGSADLWATVLPNTVVFAVVAVVLTVVLGTLVALLLARLTPLVRGLVTTAIMVAWAMPAVTGTYVWVFVFAPVDGIAVQALDALGLVDAATANPFAGRISFYAVAALNVVHHGFPFVALTVLAGLLTIPRELTEAAIMDGASAWRRFWSLTFPMLRPVFAVVTVLSTIWDFKVFTQIYLMPGGDGVNRNVLTLGTWSYVESFAQNRYGLGAAIAVLLTAMLLVVTMAYLRLLFREEEL